MRIFENLFGKKYNYPAGWRKPRVRDGIPTKWGWTIKGVDFVHIGEHVDIGNGTYIKAEYGAGIAIGDHVQIGGGCKIYAVNSIDDISGPIIIAESARIGANSVILPNTEIGKGAKIGALSLVNGTIPPNQLWTGAPAKFVREIDNAI